MAVRIQIRRDTATSWTEANPILATGEIGFVTDLRKLKVGNGTDNWTALQYLTSGSEAELIALINKNTADLQTEQQTRASADASLQTSISNESAARAEGDNELSGRIQALETAEPEVPPGLADQVQTNTESIVGLVKNDENLVEAINGKMALPQGELLELNPTDWLIIGRTDPNAGTTPTYLSRLSTLTEAVGGDTTELTEKVETLESEVDTLQNQFAGGSNLINALDGRVTANEEAISGLDERLTLVEENGGGGGTPSGNVLTWLYGGEVFFGQPDANGIKVHPNGIGIYVSKTNANGVNIEAEFLNEFQPGNIFTLQVPARTNGDNGDTTQYMQFSIQQPPVSQGNWWNVATSRIINTNTNNPWVEGTTLLDIVVQVAPRTRFLLTDPEEQPEDIITDPDLLAHWQSYRAEQGWEDDYVPTQQDVNRYFNEIDQIQQSALRDVGTRLEKLEEGTEPPAKEGFGAYNFAGETWWGQPDEGELWMNFGESQFFMSAIDADGISLKSFYEGLVKGQSIAVQGPNGFARFLLKAAPSFGSSQNGDYFTIAVREEYVQGEMEIGDRIVLILEESREGNYGFEVSLNEDPIAELVETVARMKKELTALKGQVTRLKNGT